MTNETITNRVTYDKTIGIVNNNPLGRGFAHPIDMASKNGELFVLNNIPLLRGLEFVLIEKNIFGSLVHMGMETGSSGFLPG